MPRTVRTALRGTAAAICAVVSLQGLASCSDDPGASEEVFDPEVVAVDLGLTAPSYVDSRRGRTIVRAGETERVLPRPGETAWLPGDRVLWHTFGQDGELQVVDVRTGRIRRLASEAFEMPSRALTQVNLLKSIRTPVSLRAWDVTGEPLDVPALPPIDDPEAPEGSEAYRNYFGAVPTIDGVTFVRWHDGSEQYDGDRGILRIEGDELDNVLVNEPIVGLYLASDGAGLLALRQRDGEPCGGCVVEQEVVEIDPATGEVAGSYGMPDDYTRDWRVEAMDKVGDRVAVRFSDYPERGGPSTLVGTWVYTDGEWEPLPGSDEQITWWQGADRVVGRPVGGRLDRLDLSWVHEGEERSLGVRLDTLYGTVPGALLPPG